MSTKIENYKFKELQKWYRKSPGQVLKNLINDEIIRFRESNQGDHVLYIGLVDFNQKFKSKRNLSYIVFDNLLFNECLKASQKLPFEDNTFDKLVISYGFRNLGDPEKGLNEFYRVLKPGGKIGILEFL